ncbi:MAG TPA: ABC transporter permease [Burkholderiales bacterium]|nr:ABC transporter permease [Burkholderiales bacterium]
MSLVFNAMYLAWSDTRARYSKSVLGPFWLTFGNLISILGLSIVWSALLKQDMHTFVPTITIGMIVWQLVSGAITDGATTFIRQAPIIRNVSMPTWFFVVRSLTRQVINLLHNLVIVVGVIWYFHLPLTAVSLLAIPGLLLVILNLSWITYILGLFGARFRDLEYTIASLMPLFFFITPVIFRADKLPISMKIISLNPLSYFIEVVRDPVFGEIPTLKAYAVMLGLLAFGAIASVLFNRRYRHRLAFWL